MQTRILFSIITYRPNPLQLNKLLTVLKPYHILVIDNTKNNLGFAGGTNKAIKYALEKDIDWLVILNQDLTFTPSAIKKFITILTRTQPGIAGPFIGTLDKKRWTTTLKPHPNPLLIGEGKRVRSLYISGSFFAIHKMVLEKNGLFYQPYFMYYEDVDYCLRAQKAGFLLQEIKLAGITHHDGSSLEKGSYQHEYYLARNHLLFIKRNAPWSIKLYELIRAPKTIYEHLKSHNRGALRGILDFYLDRFGQYI